MLKKRRSVLSTWIGLGVLLLLSFYSFAATSSEIISSDPDIKVEQTLESGADLLFVRPPNSHGISVNNFSAFSSSTKPLKIVNVPSYVVDDTTGVQTPIGVARLIVIIADHIEIENNIQLLGPAADVLFLSTTQSGTISCNGCSFSNALRISFATATPEVPITLDSSNVGIMKPTTYQSSTSAAIDINGLTAPGIIGLDIVTDSLKVEGKLDTNQYALIDINGGYTADLNGDVVIGSAEVNMVLGPISWDYDNHEVTSFEDNEKLYSVGGNLRSSAVKISVAGSLGLYSTIETRSDQLSSVNYLDSVFIPEESVQLQVYSNPESSSPARSLNVYGSIYSSGEVSLRSSSDLYVGPASSTTAEKVILRAANANIVAGRTVKLKGDISAGNLAIAGEQVFNEGTLHGLDKLELWAESLIANQYGGTLYANILRAKTAGVFRNGSRTPYISNSTERNGFLDLAGDNLVEANDPTKLGTYYSVPGGVGKDPSAGEMATNNFAHVVANNIGIDASAFENINPYYERVSQNPYSTQGQDYPIYFKLDKVNQVLFSAEEAMTIRASRYIVNSSAQLVVNNPVGTSFYSTEFFSNDRYRIVSLLSYSDLPAISKNGAWSFENVMTYPEALDKSVYISSPPGVIVDMGSTRVQANSAILNNASSWEVFGDAWFDTLSVHILGYENQGVQRETVVTETLETNSAYIFDITIETTVSNPTLNNPKEIASFFFVHGTIYSNANGNAKNSDIYFTNLSPFDDFVDAAINNVRARSYAQFYNTTEYEAVYFLGNNTGMTRETKAHNSIAGLSSTQQAKESVSIVVNWIDTTTEGSFQNIAPVKYIPISTGGITIFIPVTNLLQNTVTTTSEQSTQSYSLFDELLVIWQALSTTVSDIFNEYNWWGE